MFCFKFLLFTMISAWPISAKELIDYRLSSTLSRITRSVKSPDCNSFTLYCDDCDHVYFCDESTEPTLAQTCLKGQYCNNGECTAKQPVECSDFKGLPFLCKTEGLLPDPADCQSYHICLKDKIKTDPDPTTTTTEPPAARAITFALTPTNYNDYEERTCTGKYYYNPKTGYCDLPLPTSSCTDYVVPLCLKGGQSGALTRNPSIYYRCLQYSKDKQVLYPFLYICPNGKTFNIRTGCK